MYFLATIQFVWCYLWLTRPYVSTALYEQGRERMPFQGRMLLMMPLRWAHHSRALAWLPRRLGGRTSGFRDRWRRRFWCRRRST
jgi:hypothetical protein